VTLGKVFVECLIKSTRQRSRCRCTVRRALFTKCHTRQSCCRVFIGLCRVLQALSKASDSGSEGSRPCAPQRDAVALMPRGIRRRDRCTPHGAAAVCVPSGSDAAAAPTSLPCVPRWGHRHALASGIRCHDRVPPDPPSCAWSRIHHRARLSGVGV
jgi:hypothetical protein